MKVFLSWSGNKSHKVAIELRNWLPSVIQAVEPYVSSEDIDKGARWSSDIAKELEDSAFGIICVTKDNIHAPWLTFEAGALSKKLDKAYVSPFLFDIKRSDINGPILQFQSTVFEKDDIKKLVKTINKACGDDHLTEERLEKAFDVWYPSLQDELNKIKKEFKDEEPKISEPEKGKQEILEEILELTRINQKILRSPEIVLPPDYLRKFLVEEKFSEKDLMMMKQQQMIMRQIEHQLSTLRLLVDKYKTDGLIVDEDLEKSLIQVFEYLEHFNHLGRRLKVKQML